MAEAEAEAWDSSNSAWEIDISYWGPSLIAHGRRAIKPSPRVLPNLGVPFICTIPQMFLILFGVRVKK